MNYVAAGYLSTAALLGLYAWRVLHRGRVLARTLDAGSVPPPATAAQPDGQR